MKPKDLFFITIFTLNSFNRNSKHKNAKFPLLLTIDLHFRSIYSRVTEILIYSLTFCIGPQSDLLFDVILVLKRGVNSSGHFQVFVSVKVPLVYGLLPLGTKICGQFWVHKREPFEKAGGIGRCWKCGRISGGFTSELVIKIDNLTCACWFERRSDFAVEEFVPVNGWEECLVFDIIDSAGSAAQSVGRIPFEQESE